jgi:CheY-like chemotaxis protein
MGTSRQERVLGVDDNAIFRETLAQWLRASGYEVITAG